MSRAADPDANAHEPWHENWIARVTVPADGTPVDPDELLAWTKERIAGFKRPRSVDVDEALPRNATGKVLKKELRAPFEAS